MSAYTDWKYGLITDAEYNTICREEYMRDMEDDWNDEEVFEDDELEDF